ncbi:MAG: MotA/TolQ/ExbB proton channel family protein [Synergistaceae bacterium]|nr:MotA/TolQ/ExbB proton channel family protein [Synergistaceae bacterium]
MMEIMNSGGFLMWAIAALSVMGCAVAFERLLFYFCNSVAPEALELKIGEALWNGDGEAAIELVKGSNKSLHRLYFAGLTHWNAPYDALKELLMQEVRRETFRWGRHVGLLSTIARVAPLLGLLGTVLGMVDMFQALPEGGSMVAVAGGIWKALFTTVAGLIVAIPALLLHTWLCSIVDDEEEKLYRAAEFLIRERML